MSESLYVCVFGLVSLFNGISTFVGNLMPKSSLWKNKLYYSAYCWEGNAVHTFPKGISSKMNITVQLEFELSYLEASV